MKIQINEFTGIMPKIGNDKLPPNMGQTFADVRTESKELRPYRRSVGDLALVGSSYKTFFEYFENSNSHWCYYDSLVYAVRSPVADDTFERMYFTNDADDSYNAFANDILSGGGFDFTSDFYQPGAPADSTAPTLAGYTGSGSTYRAYFYTYVSRYGEEGPGSAISDVSDYASGRMQINSIDYPSTYDHLVTATESPTFLNRPKIRVYRTSDDGAGGAAFLLVCEAEWFDTTHDYAVGDFVFYDDGGGYDLYECTTIHAAGAWNGGNFTAGELVTDANLGDTCDSFLWNEAVSGITNLRSHPNGFFVASKDNMLYFTEPFAPWAWPEDYQIPIADEIIGLGIFGSTIVVCTDAWLYTFTGPHPSSLYKTKLSFQPCLAQRGVVETDTGVMFPATEGFQHVTAQGVANVTADFFRPDDWANYELETMHGGWYNKAYYGWYKSADYQGGVRIDFQNGSITTMVDYHYASYTALQDGVFRTIGFSELDDVNTLYIAQYNADTSAYHNYHYKSPRFILEKPGNFKVAQVIIDTDFYNDVLEIIEDGSILEDLNQDEWDKLAAGNNWNTGDLEGPINGWDINSQDINGDTLYSLGNLGVQNYVEFRVYVNSVLKFTKQIMNSQMFKLPRGFKHKKWEIEMSGMIPVKRVTLATSTEEIV